MLALDCISQLIHPFTTSEQVVNLGLYTVRHPALLDQIEQTVTGTTTGGQVFRSAYGSKPAGRIDCLAFLQRIDQQSKSLALEYGIPLKPLRPRLSALGGAVGLFPHKTITSWWVSARVLTQHDGPPLAPDVHCPNEECDRRGTLRIRFDPNVALCINCGVTWSDTHPDPANSFGRLTVWIRWAVEHLSGSEHPGCTECLVERKARSERGVNRALAGPRK